MLSDFGMIDELRTKITTGKIGKINVSRLILGGVVAGVVLDAITGLANARIFDGEFHSWANGMGNHLHPPGPPIQMCFWVVMCLIDGMVGVRTPLRSVRHVCLRGVPLAVLGWSIDFGLGCYFARCADGRLDL
jgi:hypothetical protein